MANGKTETFIFPWAESTIIIYIAFKTYEWKYTIFLLISRQLLFGILNRNTSAMIWLTLSCRRNVMCQQELYFLAKSVITTITNIIAKSH